MKDKRIIFLSHFLQLVPFDGISLYTMKQAAKQAGLESHELKILFPNGMGEVVEFFALTEQDYLKSRAEALQGMRIPEKIEYLMLCHLEHRADKKEAVRRIIAYQALPWNIKGAMAQLYRIVDVMWELAGDQATDFNFYTKRATLVAVYSSTLIFWLNDNSENLSATQAFLKRRLQQVATFGKKVKQGVSRLPLTLPESP